MKKYSFTCTCGDVMTVEGADEAQAKTNFAAMMTEDAAKAHFAEKHPGQTMPPYDMLMSSAQLTEVM